MKKKDLISEISKNTGIEQIAVQAVLDQFTALVKKKSLMEKRSSLEVLAVF